MAFQIRKEKDFARIEKMKVADLVIVGYGIPVIVLWLIVFKPF